MVEKVIAKYTFESPALRWWSKHTLDLHVEHVCDEEAILGRVRRLRKGARKEMQGILQGEAINGEIIVADTRYQEVLSKWNWTEAGKHEINTPEGLLNLTLDGEAAIKKAARKAWMRRAWQHEKRGYTSDILEQWEPWTRLHDEWFMDKSKGWVGLDVALGNCPDYKRMKVQTDDPVVCTCGQVNPSRRHWMSECEHTKNKVPDARRETGTCFATGQKN